MHSSGPSLLKLTPEIVESILDPTTAACDKTREEIDNSDLATEVKLLAKMTGTHEGTLTSFCGVERFSGTRRLPLRKTSRGPSSTTVVSDTRRDRCMP